MIHPTAEISTSASVGQGTRVWRNAHIREGAQVGSNCIIGERVYIDADVVLGDNVKVQNGASIYHGVTLEAGVFIGPHVCFTNDRLPRAITPEGKLKGAEDWEVGRTLVRYGASIGAGAIVLTDLTIGEWALIGAGAVVTKDVPSYALVAGNPARRIAYVCQCGRRLVVQNGAWVCLKDGLKYVEKAAGGLIQVDNRNDSNI